MEARELGRQLEQHHRESFGWALSCCGRDRSRAEDVLQRVYLKVLEGKARFAEAPPGSNENGQTDGGPGRAGFKTWLFAVIRTTARDEHRREVLRRIGLLRYEHRLAGTQPDHRDHVLAADAALDRERLQGTFVTALARLPERQRQTLQLVFYHEMSLAEAAKVMGVSIGSARTHYERAKKSLRRYLGTEGVQ
jgi:RNA polymerase sigma-70 factor (ECF subfamily)